MMMKLVNYLALLDRGERDLADAFELLVKRHGGDAEIRDTAPLLRDWSVAKRLALQPAIERYGHARELDAHRLRDVLMELPRVGGFGALRDLHDADVLAHHVFVTWTVVEKAALALRDADLAALAKQEMLRTERQARWLRTQIKTNAAQALTVVAEKRSELAVAVRAKIANTIPEVLRSPVAAAAFALVVAGFGGALLMRARR